jgi:hypothetical protein
MSEIGVSNENHISACSRRAAKHPIGDYDENSASYNDCGGRSLFRVRCPCSNDDLHH